VCVFGTKCVVRHQVRIDRGRPLLIYHRPSPLSDHSEGGQGRWAYSEEWRERLKFVTLDLESNCDPYTISTWSKVRQCGRELAMPRTRNGMSLTVPRHYGFEPMGQLFSYGRPTDSVCTVFRQYGDGARLFIAIIRQIRVWQGHVRGRDCRGLLLRLGQVQRGSDDVTSGSRDGRGGFAHQHRHWLPAVGLNITLIS